MKKNPVISPIKYRILAGLLLFIFTLLSLRLADLQLWHGQELFERSQDNKSFQETLSRRRGVILDRYQEPIALNTPVYFLRDSGKLFAKLMRISADEALDNAARFSNNLELVIGAQRSYPFAAGLAHVLGYTGSVSVKDLRKDADLKPNDDVGKSGLERSFEKLLRGTPGAIIYTVDASGNRLAVEKQIPGKSGQVLQTSLDPFLSRVASKIMSPFRGSVIISDPKTGQILTLLSSPSFDPNLLTKTKLDRSAEKKRREQVRQIISHPQNLFFNRALTGVYPPGSVFKLVTAIAGLESGAITADTEVEDTGVLTVNDFSYANWYYSQYSRKEGILSLRRAIARSNDIFFYKTAEATGADHLAEFARLFGFGVPTKIELGGEAAGLVPTPQWKEQTLGERWYLGNTYHFGIGQGLLLVTPIQVAQMTASIANKGTHCPVSLLSTKQQCEGLGIKQATLDLVVAGMLDACSTGGTGYPLFAYNKKYRNDKVSAYEAVSLGAIACKTGTAEFGGDSLAGKKNTHAWFTAIVGTKPITDALSESAIGSSQIVATDSAQVSSQNQWKIWHTQWSKQVHEYGLPETLAFTVLVESDEAEPFREGSRDAAPVVAKLLEWMRTGEIRDQ